MVRVGETLAEREILRRLLEAIKDYEKKPEDESTGEPTSLEEEVREQSEDLSDRVQDAPVEENQQTPIYPTIDLYGTTVQETPQAQFYSQHERAGSFYTQFSQQDSSLPQTNSFEEEEKEE